MDIKDIENLAELSKIELSDKEKNGLQKDLDAIIAYIRQIGEVEVKNSKIEYQNRNIFREDEIKSPLFSPELITGQFPDSKDNFLKVKKIL